MNRARAKMTTNDGELILNAICIFFSLSLSLFLFCIFFSSFSSNFWLFKKPYSPNPAKCGTIRHAKKNGIRDADLVEKRGSEKSRGGNLEIVLIAVWSQWSRICLQVEVDCCRSRQSISHINRNLINRKPNETVPALPSMLARCSADAVIDVKSGLIRILDFCGLRSLHPFFISAFALSDYVPWHFARMCFGYFKNGEI